MRKLDNSNANTKSTPKERKLTSKPTDVIDLTDKFFANHRIDVTKLVEEAKMAESLYPYVKKAVSGWKGIPLRSIAGNHIFDVSDAVGVHASSEPRNFMDTKLMQPYIREVIEKVGGKNLLKVRLMKLEAGRVIAEHIDIFNGTKSGNVRRYHIPIVTNPDIAFYVNHKRYYLEPGKMYQIDVTQFHSVENNSDMDRIHLVFDVSN